MDQFDNDRSPGEALWQSLDLHTEFEQVQRRADGRMISIIAESDEAAILQLPWETLCHPGHS